MSDTDLWRDFGCGLQADHPAATEDLWSWYRRIPDGPSGDVLADYRGGRYSINGVRGAVDAWTSQGPDLNRALAVLAAEYPEDDALELVFEGSGCIGPFAEACAIAVTRFHAFHGGADGAAGSRRTATVNIHLAYNPTHSGDTQWQRPMEKAWHTVKRAGALITGAVKGLFGSAVKAFTGGTRSRQFCSETRVARRAKARNLVVSGVDAIRRLHAVAREVFAAQRAAQSASVWMDWDPVRVPVMVPPPGVRTTIDPDVAQPEASSEDLLRVRFEWGNERGNGPLRGIAERIPSDNRTRIDAEEFASTSFQMVGEHDFSGPLLWAQNLLNHGQALSAFRVGSECWFSQEAYRSAWTSRFHIGNADPWLQIAPLVAADVQGDVGGPPDIAAVWMTRAAWRQLVRWDHLYRAYNVGELEALNQMLPSDAESTLQLARRMGFRIGDRIAVEVVLRDVEFHLDGLLAYIQFLQARGHTILDNPVRAWREQGIDGVVGSLSNHMLGPAGLSALCTLPSMVRVGGSVPFAAEGLGPIGAVCGAPYRAAYEDAAPTALTTTPPLLALQGFVLIAMRGENDVRVVRMMLPNMDAGNEGLLSGFGRKLLAHALAGDGGSRKLLQSLGRLGGGLAEEPGEFMVARMLQPERERGPFADRFAREWIPGSADRQTNYILLAITEGDQTFELHVDQFLVPSGERPTRPPEAVSNLGKQWVDVLGNGADSLDEPAPAVLRGIDQWGAIVGAEEPALGGDGLGAAAHRDARMYVDDGREQWAMVSVGEPMDGPSSPRIASIVQFCTGECRP